MKIKTYRTRELKGYVLHLQIDGKLNTVAFKRGCTLGSTATFTTADEKVQDALESLRAFGPTFFLESTKVTGEEVLTGMPKQEEKPVVEESEVVDVLDVQTFRNLVELRNALQDKGIDVSQITNVKAAEAIARKNGYNYTVVKKA